MGVNHLPASSPAYIALPQQRQLKEALVAPVSAQTVAGTLAGVNLASGSGHTQSTSAVGISLNINGSPKVNSCDSQVSWGMTCKLAFCCAIHHILSLWSIYGYVNTFKEKCCAVFRIKFCSFPVSTAM